MKLKTLLAELPFAKVTKPIHKKKVKRISMDSRSTQAGDLFVCIRGVNTDGHRFASQAAANGAVAIIAEQELDVSVPVIRVNDSRRALAQVASKFYHHPTSKLPVIGITGTNGKTTVAYLIDELFSHDHKKTAMIGTIQVKIGNRTLPVKNTTPDALTIQKYFHQMVEEKVEAAIMEVSSHALDQGRVFGCEFDVAVFTNLTRDHLDYHDGFEDYLRAKSLLFAQLGNGYNRKRDKIAVVNNDSVSSGKIIRSTAQPFLTYGIEQQADLMATDIRLQETGTCFIMKTPKGEVAIDSPLMGRFSIYNMLAAAAVGIIFDLPLSLIQHSFENTKGIPGRFESIREGQPFGVVVDYAHTPDSLESVLETISAFCRGSVRVVVGCGGDRDREKRPQMADVAMKYGEQVIFTSDNPRTEDPAQIFHEMTSHLKEGYEVMDDREEAIRCALTSAREGDVVLIAGKGHETFQEINGDRRHFDDREVARRILKGFKEHTR
ncbi:UDP-N-acetylmuramoyl-L-alanyl-D-glutamate--2,6-diaminopimelate ligase [Halobacillus fulvus]|nr:UDP-N-acetylmuramoyl-L-alanyl-D-glutamate--2,6-diaminopimelate ligase [Halobacillus fulvus]